MSTDRTKTPTKAPTTLDTARAMIEESVLTRWQFWRDWLTLGLERLELQAQGGAEEVTFDLDEAHGAARLREIEAQIAAIPAAARAEFQVAYDLSRQEMAERLERTANGRPGGDDVFAAERAAYQELIAVCMGDPASGTDGEVPLNGEWYRFDTRALRQVPGAERFALGRAGRRANWGNYIGIGLVVVVAAFPLVSRQLRPSGQGTTAIVGAPAVLVENVAVVAPRPLTLAFVAAAPDGATDAGGGVEIAITPVAYGAWPHPADAAGTAAWRTGTGWPIELCLPRDQLMPTATGLRLMSAGDMPPRRYHLRAAVDGASPASLVLRDCSGDTRLTRYGSVVEVAPPVTAAVGASQTTPDGSTITLDSVAVVGPSQVALPSDRVQVQVTVRGTGVTDWASLRPSLLLATGEEVSLSATIGDAAADGSVNLAYLVTTFTHPLEAAWQVTTSATGQVTRWRFTLTPPPTRRAYLDQTITLVPPQATRTGIGQLRLALRVRNTGTAPLTMRADDLVITQGPTPVLVPALDPATTTIAAGATGAITLDLTLPDPSAGATLTIGRVAYAIDPEGG